MNHGRKLLIALFGCLVLEMTLPLLLCMTWTLRTSCTVITAVLCCIIWEVSKPCGAYVLLNFITQQGCVTGAITALRALAS